MDLDKEIQKAIVKEAIKEWLDEQAEAFGKWTIRWIGGAVASALIYVLFTGGFLK